jgi:hypothetical protein
MSEHRAGYPAKGDDVMPRENGPGDAKAAVFADAGTSRAVIDVTKHQGLRASNPSYAMPYYDAGNLFLTGERSDPHRLA